MEGNKTENTKKSNRTLIIIAILVLLIIILILFFIFSGKTYEVTFNSNGGSYIEAVKVKKNDKVEEPIRPIKEGYIFAGWYYLDELYDFDTPVTQDMTLEAEWAVQGYAEVSGISLSETQLTLTPDSTAVLVATLFPENAKQVKLIWTSSDEEIATVDENGNIKALKEGNADITVTTEDGKYKAKCTITITQDAIPVDGISISGAKEVRVGGKIKLTATVTPEDATNKSVIWKSSNPYVAKVDKNGNVTGLKAGKVTITVKTADGGYEATYTITVKANTSSNNNQNGNSNNDKPSTPSTPNTPNTPSKPSNPSTPDNPEEKPSIVEPTGIKISGPTTVEVGSSITLTATVTPNEAANKSVAWSSSDEKIATVENGKVTGKSAGTVTITAKTVNGKTDTYKVTVKAKDVPQPPKEDTYSIVFTRIRQEGTNNVMQYTYVVYKNESSFSGYLGFECGGVKTAKGTKNVSLKSEDTSATLTLDNGSTVTATVTYKN